MGSNQHATRLAVTLLTALAALAQHGEPAPGKLLARELPGYGELRFEVSSKSIAARKWANQGLRLVYAFNHPEAAASFRKATELDPECAMCGEASRLHWAITSMPP